jgi:hypothetical protein
MSKSKYQMKDALRAVIEKTACDGFDPKAPQWAASSVSITIT